MNLNFRLILFYTAFLYPFLNFAQSGGNSPYSVLGIGDISHPGYIRNYGMGGTGISNAHPEFINIQNPALLHVNKYFNKDSTIQFTMLEAGFNGQVRRLITQQNTEISNGFNINYFSFAFPVSSRWTTSLGLRPYSQIQNKVISNLSFDKLREANVVSAENDYSIQGSLNQFHFANGIDLTKNFSVGILGSYIFGNVIEQSVTQAQLFQDGSYTSNTGSNIHTFYNGFQIKPGISYSGEIRDSSKKGSGTFFNAGITVDNFFNFRGQQSSKLVSKENSEAIVTLSDTTITNRNITIPPITGLGISFHRPDRWSVALDVSYSPWSMFNSFASSYANTKMSDSYTVALGAELKPSQQMSLGSKEYRIGFSYTKSAITINNKQLNDAFISLGTSVPFGRKDTRFKSKPLTKINAALIIGNRGTTEGGLIREQYFKIHIGALIHDRWFQRWRID